MKQLVAAVLVASLPVFSASVFAHGDAYEKKKPAAVMKEQKAWGISGDSKAAKRTIRISMTDKMRFVPDAFSVKEGETVRIILKKRRQDAA